MQLVVSVDDSSIRVWDTRTCEQLYELRQHKGNAFVLECHPTDSRIGMWGAYDGIIYLFDLATGERLSRYLHGTWYKDRNLVCTNEWPRLVMTAILPLGVFVGVCEQSNSGPQESSVSCDWNPCIFSCFHLRTQLLDTEHMPRRPAVGGHQSPAGRSLHARRVRLCRH